MKLDKDLLILGAVGIGAYFLYKKFSGLAEEAKNALANAGTAVSSKLFDIFHPASIYGDDYFFNVGFQDGSNHAVGASLVASNGTFTLNGTRYQMVTSRDNGKHYATPV